MYMRQTNSVFKSNKYMYMLYNVKFSSDLDEHYKVLIKKEMFAYKTPLLALRKHKFVSLVSLTSDIWKLFARILIGQLYCAHTHTHTHYLVVPRHNWLIPSILYIS